MIPSKNCIRCSKKRSRLDTNDDDDNTTTTHNNNRFNKKNNVRRKQHHQHQEQQPCYRCTHYPTHTIIMSEISKSLSSFGYVSIKLTCLLHLLLRMYIYWPAKTVAVAAFTHQYHHHHHHAFVSSLVSYSYIHPTSSYVTRRSFRNKCPNFFDCDQGCCLPNIAYSSRSVLTTRSKNNPKSLVVLYDSSETLISSSSSGSNFTEPDIAFSNLLFNQLDNNNNDNNHNQDEHHSKTLPSLSTLLLEHSDGDGDDVPRPTENGGYSHTAASRAKISAANKGKVPWNKGQNRPDDVRARIAAGVRAKNRERFLLKLAGMGLTEEEFIEKKQQERRIRDADRRARRTEKGGYRPTDETRQKISQVLKEKYARGDIKSRYDTNSTNGNSTKVVRRGFTHSPETRQKISESLRKLWSKDESYRAKMILKSNELNSRDDVRQKISSSLRTKWQDEEFRQYMLSVFATRRSYDDNSNNKTNSSSVVGNKKQPNNSNNNDGLTYRERISVAMKAKWQEEEYRNKALAAFATRKKNKTLSSSTTTTTKKQQPKKVTATPVMTNGMGESKSIAMSNIMHQKKNGYNGYDSSSSLLEQDLQVRIVQPLTQPRKKVPGKRKNSRKVDFVTADEEVAEKIPKILTSASSSHKSSLIANSKNINNKVDNNPVPRYTDELLDFDDAFGDNFVEIDTDDDIIFEEIMDKYNKMDPSKGRGATGDASTTSRPSSSNVHQQNSVANGNNKNNNNRLHELRPDLYDLLYGDDNDDNNNNKSNNNRLLSSRFLGDENLDTFDPYGLEDF